MAGQCFDTWTRRRFGAAGLFALSLVGSAGLGNAEGRKKHKHKKKCRKSRQSCGGHKKCCKGLNCGQNVDGPNQCCKPPRSACSVATDCCGDFVCSAISGLDGNRCCSFFGFGACNDEQDCCAGLLCIAGICS
jgi:hypothetical protein